MIHDGPIWLVDATRYRRELAAEAVRSKSVFFRLETLARSRTIGEVPDRGVKSFSQGLLRLATRLDVRGYVVRYVDVTELPQLLAEPARAEAPRAVAFGAVTPTVPLCATWARAVKERWPDTRVVLGGPHAQAAPEATRRREYAFDCVSVASEEAAVADIVGGPPRAGPRAVDADLSLLPSPLPEYGFNLVTASGCPFRCAYCQDGRASRSALALDGGLAELVRILPARTPIHYADSVLGGGGLVRLHEVCRVISGIGHDFTLSCDIRPEMCTHDVVTHLATAGFREVRIGLESADPEVTSAALRGTSRHAVERALAVCREASDLYVSGYLVTGLPGSTRATHDRNVEWVHDLLACGLVDQVKHHLYVPYPSDGGPLRGVTVTSESWEGYDRSSFPVFRLPGLTEDEIWQQFLDVEEAINLAWAARLGADVDRLDDVRLFRDYNVDAYGIPSKHPVGVSA